MLRRLTQLAHNVVLTFCAGWAKKFTYFGGFRPKDVRLTIPAFVKSTSDIWAFRFWLDKNFRSVLSNPLKGKKDFSVDTQRRFNIHVTLYRCYGRWTNVVTTFCASWMKFVGKNVKNKWFSLACTTQSLISLH